MITTPGMVFVSRKELQNDFAPQVGDALMCKCPMGRHARDYVRYEVVGQKDLP